METQPLYMGKYLGQAVPSAVLCGIWSWTLIPTRSLSSSSAVEFQSVIKATYMAPRTTCPSLSNTQRSWTW